MSCIICGQDVPVIPTVDDADVVACVRCRARFSWTAVRSNPLRLDKRHGSPSDGSVTTDSRPEPPPIVADDDDWDDMYHPTDHRILETPESLSVAYRMDRAESKVTESKVTESKVTEAKVTELQVADERRSRSNWLQWLILSLGAAMFSCGAALIAWSFGDDRQDLWNLGAPMALAGQAAFLIGLVLQLDVIWRQNRQARRRLDELDHRVLPLAGTALNANQSLDGHGSLGTSPTPDAGSLLDELKGQLDRMATRLTRHRD